MVAKQSDVAGIQGLIGSRLSAPPKIRRFLGVSGMAATRLLQGLCRNCNLLPVGLDATLLEGAYWCTTCGWLSMET